jgi:ATP-binding cassette subfamily C protein
MTTHAEEDVRILTSSSPVDFDEADTAWMVLSGEVDVFVVPATEAGERGRRFYVGSARVGSLIVGSPPLSRAGSTWTLVGVGVDAQVRHLGSEWIEQVCSSEELQAGVHHWLSDIATARVVAGPLLAAGNVEPGAELNLVAGQVVNSRNELRWLATDGASIEVGHETVDSGVPLPLGFGAYMSVVTPGVATIRRTEELTPAEVRSGLSTVTAALLSTGVDLATEDHERAMLTQVQRRAQESRAREQVMSELESIDQTEPALIVTAADPLLAACELVGTYLRLPIVPPPDWSREQSTDPVRAIARASGARVRAVTLSDPWWVSGIDAMVAFRTEGGKPVALLPRRSRGFDLVDPADGSRTVVDATVAAGLRPTAYVLYPTLPAEGIGVRQLIAFGLRGGRGDLLRTFAFSLIAGLLSLVIPIATGAILGNLVPQGNSGLIVAASASLFLVVFASTGFLLARSGGLLRIQGRLLSNMQSGLWDRLIALPVEFFRRFSVADLSLRVAGVEMIQQIIASVASQTLLALVTIVFSLALLFFYDTGLATLVLVVTLVVVSISATLTWLQIRRLRAMFDAKGEASAVLLQLVQGVDKVRAAAAEERALDAWSRKFATQARFLLSSQRLSAVRAAMYAALPVLLTLTVFTVVGSNPGMMTTAAFLSFIAALGQIASATAQLDLSLGYMLNIVPIFDRMRPILEEPVELSEGASDPGPLQGQVALNNVSFRYPGMSATVLNDVDLVVTPGEFVAIVGPSGSGKSTIVRLLLGFEKPEAGSVTYDSKDLATLDARAVRSQIGVAMQNAAVTGGDILSAIRGDWPLTEAQAWAAAEKVGLADEIRALPMGMRTLLGDNAVTFSGGQRQRLVLAGAIARNPRIVILDEATSALDSVTQAQVADSFAGLHVTRIVVAHRLSTIRRADRVVVIDRGRIVQEGGFEELAGTPGLFANMVARQTL